MTDQDERLERLAAAYATEQGFPRKGEGDGRDSYSTLMKYEVRSYVSDAWLSGYRAALEGEEVRGLVEALGRVNHAIANAWEWQCSDPEDSELDRDQQIGNWCEKACDEIKSALARFRGESK